MNTVVPHADGRELGELSLIPHAPPLQTDQHSGNGGLVRSVLLGISVALLAAFGQGLVALFFDVGLLYPVIGYWIGSRLHAGSSGLPGRGRQVLAVLLTYFAVALSPLIPYGRAVGFDPIRMLNTSLGLVMAFVPLMARAGLIGILNLGLLLFGLRYAWVQSGKPHA